MVAWPISADGFVCHLRVIWHLAYYLQSTCRDKPGT